MKKIMWSLALICSSFSFGQQPETVYSIALEIREIPWYEQQLKLWRAEIDKNKQNGTAWTNYYMAARALRNLSGNNPEKLKLYQQQCAGIVEDLHKSYPDSFEDYYIAFIDAGNPENDAQLLKAIAINPHDDRILDEMLIHGAIKSDRKEFENYCTEMYRKNQLPPAILNWGHNLLAELDENAIVLTVGDNDTYAAWINQGALGFRKDVTVINTSLILIDNYRSKLFQQIGLPPFTAKFDDATNYDDYMKRLLQHIFSGSRPVYVSNSGVAYIPDALKGQLYLTGLAHRYSKTPLETSDLIIRNYENRYLLDYLQTSFSWHFADEKSLEFNSMYLPSMIKLYWHYEQTEQITKQKRTEQLLSKIAAESGQQAEVMELLKSKDKNSVLMH